jgi:hypothetical protein
MSDKKFIWLIDTQHPRRGPTLETGKEYSVDDYGENVVAVWIKSRAAKYVKEKKGESLKEENN